MDADLVARGDDGVGLLRERLDRVPRDEPGGAQILAAKQLQLRSFPFIPSKPKPLLQVPLVLIGVQ